MRGKRARTEERDLKMEKVGGMERGSGLRRERVGGKEKGLRREWVGARREVCFEKGECWGQERRFVEGEGRGQRGGRERRPRGKGREEWREEVRIGLRGEEREITLRT